MILNSPASPDNYGPARTLPVQLIVIHVESGTEAGTLSWFASPQAHVSAHYSIAKVGTIYAQVPEGQIAWHAGIAAPCIWNDNEKNLWPGINPNSYSIGIENEGFDDGIIWEEAQVTALVELVADVCKRHSIPCDRAHVVGHHEIYAGHTCPGSACPLDRIVTAAAYIISGSHD